MGLETVEMMMAVEDRYGIRISDHEIGQMQTVGDLAAACRKRILASRENRCWSLVNFLALRRHTRAFLAQPALPIRPRDPVTLVIPPAARRRYFALLAEQLHLGPVRLTLTRPQRLTFFLLWACLAGWLLGQTAYDSLGATALFWAPSAALLLIPFGLSWLLLERLAGSVPPRKLATFGGLTRRLNEQTTASKPPANAELPFIFSELRPILAETLGVKESEIRMDSTWKELGVA